MKRGYKRVLSLLALICVFASLLATVSCKDRDYDEQTVINEAKVLLEKSAILNTVYYGRGINYITGANQNGAYYEADFIHLDKLGFKSVAELEALTYSVFSEDVASDIIKDKLYPDTSEGYMPRYYQKYEDEINKKEPICIMVKSGEVSVFDDRLTYDFSTLKSTGSNKDFVNMTVDVTLLDQDGKAQIQTIKFDLVEEKNGWRIASRTTFANYSEHLDRYNELTKG